MIQISCPVCREAIKDEELNDLNECKNNISSISGNSETYVISSKMRQIQDKMKILFEKQKLKGGIIDIDEKKQDVIILTV